MEDIEDLEYQLENDPEYQDSVENAYLDGFNEGYELAARDPVLAEEIAKSLAKLRNPRMRSLGLLKGRQEFLAEQTRERDLKPDLMPERDLRPDWLRGPEPDKGLAGDPSPDKSSVERTLSDKPDKDKSDIEPER